MHSVMGVMTALMVSAAGTGDEATSSNTVPEQEQRPTFVGLAVPLAPSGIAVEGERELNERFSMSLGLRVGFSVGTVNATLLGETRQNSLHMGVEPGARFYLMGSVLDGLWVGPRLELGHAWVDSPMNARRELNLGGAVLTGYSLRLGQNFCVQAAVGVGATYQLGTQSMSIVLPGGQNLVPSTYNLWNVSHRAQVAVGWAF